MRIMGNLSSKTGYVLGSERSGETGAMWKSARRVFL